MNNAVLLQDKLLQDKIQQYAMEQELYLTQRVHQNQIQFDDKNTKYFQLAGNIRKISNFVWKNLDDQGLWANDQIIF